MKNKRRNNAGKVKPTKKDGGGSNKLKSLTDKKKKYKGGLTNEAYQPY